MVNINITKVSSKGQIVIPQDMREDLPEGEKLVIIKNKDQIILKKMTDFDKNLKEDLEFARRTEDAWKRVEAGKYISVDSEDIIEEMMKW